MDKRFLSGRNQFLGPGLSSSTGGGHSQGTHSTQAGIQARQGSHRAGAGELARTSGLQGFVSEVLLRAPVRGFITSGPNPDCPPLLST
ncbi:hypothetical protein ElyMa_004209700 [Elysia marginata]|uniref:Uncharacterized protein n=1 Tax=Elysia marginata TaxID=1093978 RepID=A0AAV4GNT5_9GAST|nr:hypothetical protein ElyMa_004209700 [Elysia marginata]